MDLQSFRHDISASQLTSKVKIWDSLCGFYLLQEVWDSSGRFGQKATLSFSFWNLCFNLLSVSSVFFLPLFSSRWRRIHLPPLLYITLSSFCLCLPADAAHKELASMHGEGTHYRESISSPLCQPAPPFSFPQSTPLFFFSPSPVAPQSLCTSLSTAPNACFATKPIHIYSANQGTAFWLFTNPTCALKAPVGQK